MKPDFSASDGTINDLGAADLAPSRWSRLVSLLDAGLDAVRVVTAVLAAYQLARSFGSSALDHGAFLDVLPLWLLIVIYVASSGLTLYLGRVRTPRAKAPAIDHGPSSPEIGEDRGVTP